MRRAILGDAAAAFAESPSATHAGDRGVALNSVNACGAKLA
jgi:hypothetical protein